MSIISVNPLGFPYPTADPFLFAVYHKDMFPAGNGKMEAPRRGNGADFDWSQPYRMYHGDRIPGFPQHPHRGFETITATIEGLIDHSDSLGGCGRYGQGDLQWMTAGSGIVHGEMFPLRNVDGPNPSRFFQVWINLPAKSKMVDATYVMHWAEEIPKFVSPDRLVSIVVFAGELFGKRALPPPPDSWAADPSHEVGVWHIVLQPGGSLTLPTTRGGNVNRNLYFFEGSQLWVSGTLLQENCKIAVRADMETEISNPSGADVEVLVLQGQPIGEPVAQHGPFVMNNFQEIQQAFADYRRTQFGGWPWEEDAVVFPVDKPRFARLSKDTPEQSPPLAVKEDL
jgi:hypothetical protein